MTPKPLLPMTPDQLPAQRLVEVVELPSVPISHAPTVCMYRMPKDILPKRRPRRMTCLGTVEWAWAPWARCIETYWLHRARRHWVVWIQDRDWTNDPEIEWQVAAYVTRNGLTVEQAAPNLIVARWRQEVRDGHLDHFHFVSTEGALTVPEWMAIGRAVWGESTGT